MVIDPSCEFKLKVGEEGARGGFGRVKDLAEDIWVTFLFLPFGS